MRRARASLAGCGAGPSRSASGGAVGAPDQPDQGRLASGAVLEVPLEGGQDVLGLPLPGRRCVGREAGPDGLQRWQLLDPDLRLLEPAMGVPGEVLRGCLD